MSIKFTSVGAAASRGIRDFLLQQEMQRRQEMVDRLMVNRELAEEARAQSAARRQATLDQQAADDRQRRIVVEDRDYADKQQRQQVDDARYAQERKDKLTQQADAADNRYLDTERGYYEKDRERRHDAQQAALDRQSQERRTAMGSGRSSGDKVTEGEKKADSFYGRAVDALDVVEEVEGSVSSFNRYIPNFMQSEAGQAYEQGKRQFIEAYLRKDSGAAIADSEYANADRTYFAQPGDSAATLRRKQNARRKIAETLQQQGSGGSGGSKRSGGSKYSYSVED